MLTLVAPSVALDLSAMVVRQLSFFIQLFMVKIAHFKLTFILSRLEYSSNNLLFLA